MPGARGEFEFSIDGELLYSKKETGAYPEMRTLKQIIVKAIDAQVEAAASDDR